VRAGRTLSWVLATRTMPARGVKATPSRAGRRIAAGSIRVAGGKVQLRLNRRVPAGRYDLALTRAGRRVARQAVTVS
jgi:hypothetical protein